MSTAVIVGGGPNGLTAAVLLAKQGVEVTMLEAADAVGGGVRSGEATGPGLIHGHCSAIHPMAVGSPVLNSLELERHGLRWLWPEVDCAHPLDDGSCGLLYRDIGVTADALGRDGRRWRALFERPARNFDLLTDDIMGPLLRLPRHPISLARFGAPTVLPAATTARLFRTEQARALFGGVAAHAFRPLHYPMTSAIGMGIITAGHRHGWPVAAGGSQSITDALTALLTTFGGKVETGILIESFTQLPRADVTLFDLAPTQVANILGATCRRPWRVASRGSAMGPVRSRSISRSKAVCHGPIRARAAPERFTSAAHSQSSRRRNEPYMPGTCRSAHSFWWASSTSPTPAARTETSIRCGLTPMCHMALPVTPRRL